MGLAAPFPARIDMEKPRDIEAIDDSPDEVSVLRKETVYVQNGGKIMKKELFILQKRITTIVSMFFINRASGPLLYTLMPYMTSFY